MRTLRTTFAAALLALVAACGGGIYVGYDDDDFDDDGPRVSVAASVTSALPGAPVRLVAAASDVDGVERVRFYRVDADGSRTELGTDERSPFEFDTAIPTSAARGTTVQFYARAVDDHGHGRDSDRVGVTVL